MKKTKQILFLSIFSTALIFNSCKEKETKNDNPIDTTPQWSSNYSQSDVLKDIISNAPPVNVYTLNGSSGGTVTNDSVSVIFPADALLNGAGNLYSGTVKVKVQTIRKVSQMLYSGITAISGGEMLLSDGMIKLEVTDSANNKLKLAPGKTISMEFEATNFDPNQKFFGGKKTTNDDNKVDWDEWDSTGTKRRNGPGTSVSGIDSIFDYGNLDRYMNQTPLTDITVTTPSGFTNLNTECFIKYTGENSSAYIPSNFTLKAFSTQGAYYKVVQGRAAKIIVFAKKDGNYYYEIITISSISANHSVSASNLQQTTLAGLNAIIASF